MCGWHFPDGKAAGPTRYAWNDGEAFPDHIPAKRKRGKGLVPASVEEDEEPPSGPDPNANPLDAATQTPGTVSVLEIEIDMLRKENDRLKRELEKQKQTFSFSQISSQPDKVIYYTGLTDAATVLFLEALLSKSNRRYRLKWNVQIMPLVDQLLLTLMKLRLNCGIVDLATRFNCCHTTVANIFASISTALYDILYVGMMENNVPPGADVQTFLPDCLQPFPDCRIVLDCAEVTALQRLAKRLKNLRKPVLSEMT